MYLVVQKNILLSWVQWRMPVIPVLGRLRQEDHRLEASFSNLVRPSATP